MEITFKRKGNYDKITKRLRGYSRITNMIDFHKYGKDGVAALAAATPVDTGLTAKSWYYEIKEAPGTVTISFKNSNIQNGIPIAIILQYGHATRNGGWVTGVDYINPAIRSIFDEIKNKAWEEVRRR